MLLRQHGHDLAREGVGVEAVRAAIRDVHLIVALGALLRRELLVRDVEEGTPLQEDGHIAEHDHVRANVELAPVPELRLAHVALGNVAVGRVELRRDGLPAGR